MLGNMESLKPKKRGPKGKRGRKIQKKKSEDDTDEDDYEDDDKQAEEERLEMIRARMPPEEPTSDVRTTGWGGRGLCLYNML